MLTLPSNPTNILGDCSMHGALFSDIRYERPYWVIRAQSWSDLAEVIDGYEGPVINGARGPMRPIFVFTKIVFHDVEDILYFHETLLEHKELPTERLDPEMQSKMIDPLTQKLTMLGLPPPRTVDMSVYQTQGLKYEEFIAAISQESGYIDDAHTCKPGQFHIKFESEHNLQLKIAYGKAFVYLGNEAI